MAELTDRELLERAAKAAGFSEAKWQDLRGWGEVRYGLSEAIWNGEDYWNPLTDDGDALRLAVKLNFDVDVCKETSTVWAGAGKGECLMELGQDPYSATRRAIVRAAASLATEGGV
jgi:hypothetical protein